MFHSYRSGKYPISAKVWRKLEAAEARIGINRRSDPSAGPSAESKGNANELGAVAVNNVALEARVAELERLVLKYPDAFRVARLLRLDTVKRTGHEFFGGVTHLAKQARVAAKETGNEELAAELALSAEEVEERLALMKEWFETLLHLEKERYSTDGVPDLGDPVADPSESGSDMQAP